MLEYKIKTADALTAHRIAEALYRKLYPQPEYPLRHSGHQPVTDQVSGWYFHEGNNAGYRVSGLELMFEVRIATTKPKSGRDYATNFLVISENSTEIDTLHFEQAIRNVQSALGSRKNGKEPK